MHQNVFDGRDLTAHFRPLTGLWEGPRERGEADKEGVNGKEKERKYVRGLEMD